MGTKSLRREAERQGFLLDIEMIKSYGSSVLERVVLSQVLISLRNIESHDLYICRQM